MFWKRNLIKYKCLIHFNLTTYPQSDQINPNKIFNIGSNRSLPKPQNTPYIVNVASQPFYIIPKFPTPTQSISNENTLSKSPYKSPNQPDKRNKKKLSKDFFFFLGTYIF